MKDVSYYTTSTGAIHIKIRVDYILNIIQTLKELDEDSSSIIPYFIVLNILEDLIINDLEISTNPSKRDNPEFVDIRNQKLKDVLWNLKSRNVTDWNLSEEDAKMISDIISEIFQCHGRRG